jgi:hypothetical protein
VTLANRRSHRGRRYPVPALTLALVAVVMLAGCGSAKQNAGSAPKATASPAFGVDAATMVLAAFDRADSAASVAGDVNALQLQEMAPSLNASEVAVNRAIAGKTAQPSFQHITPAFAIPAAPATCFLVGAGLKLVGEEMNLSDFSQFILTPGSGWKISHNVQIGSDGKAAVQGMNGTAVTSSQAIGDQHEQAISSEVFGRTTASANGYSVVASSPVLDKQLAAGWSFYTQALAAVKETVTRSLDQSSWSACAATSPSGTIAFLTLDSTDTVSGLPGGPATVSLPATSPDMIALGETKTVTGKKIKVSRVDVFLMLIPATGAATVLGLSDAPVSVTTAG